MHTPESEERKTPDLPSNISSATAKHAAALFYGDSLDLFIKGSADYIQAQGTNAHVVGDYVRPTKERVFHIALAKHTPLPGRLLFKSDRDNPDFPFDIAVFLLMRERIVDGGKLPLLLSDDFAPLNVGDQGLAVGFPGGERCKRDSQIMGHPLYHVVAKCVAASDRNIVLYEEMVPSSGRVVKFGGMSGGPIFRLEPNDRYSFSGVIVEGRGFADSEEDTNANDIWVYGFPLGVAQLELAFTVFKPNLELQGYARK
jgi:hypothetical protein